MWEWRREQQLCARPSSQTSCLVVPVAGKSAAEELEDELAQVSARDEAREALAPEALEGVGLLRGTDVASKTGEGLEPLIAAALDAGNASGSGPLDPVAASESSETSTRAQNTVAGSALRTPALLPDERQGKVAADTRGDATSSTAGTASPSMGGSASAGLESPKPDAVAAELVDSHSVTPVIAPRSPGRLGINASLGLSQGNASAVAPPKGARDAGLSTKPGDAMTSRPSDLPAPSAAKEAVAHVDALSLSQPASKRKGGASVYDILVQVHRQSWRDLRICYHRAAGLLSLALFPVAHCWYETLTWQNAACLTFRVSNHEHTIPLSTPGAQGDQAANQEPGQNRVGYAGKPHWEHGCPSSRSGDGQTGTGTVV